MTVVFKHPITGLAATFEAEPSTLVSSFKTHVAASQGLTSENVHVTLAGRPVADEEDLFELTNGEDVVELDVAFDLEGGAKGKKKKKQYTTPKHVAHKRKKVKLAVLKYFRIDGNTITPTRVHCISKTCNKGVFQATHHNRTHCGRCGLTLFKGEN